jgi:regulator of CtrA degradation
MASQEAVRAMADAIIFGPQRFIDRTFDDALSLLEEVRSYILYEERSDGMDLPPAARVRQSLEATRMTARLTNVMAWLLLQKAAAAGEIEEQEPLKPENRLGGREACMDDAGVEDPDLPDRMRELLDRSHRMYVRVARLDDMMQGEKVA